MTNGKTGGVGWGCSSEDIDKLKSEDQIVMRNQDSDSFLGQQEGDATYIYNWDNHEDEYPVRIDYIRKNDDGTYNLTLTLIQKS